MYPEYQAAIYTHLDGENHILHNHIIVNKTNLITGKKLSEPRGASVSRARTINDQIAAEMGWTALERPKEARRDYEKKLVAEGKYSWLADLKQRIDKTMLDPTAVNMDTFIDRMATAGVTVTLRGQDMTMRFDDPDGKHRTRRASKLGADYERSTLDGIFRDREAATRRAEEIARREDQSDQRERRVAGRIRAEVEHDDRPESSYQQAVGRVAKRDAGRKDAQRELERGQGLQRRADHRAEYSGNLRSTIARGVQLFKDEARRIGDEIKAAIQRAARLAEEQAKKRAAKRQAKADAERLAFEAALADFDAVEQQRNVADQQAKAPKPQPTKQPAKWSTRQVQWQQKNNRGMSR